MNNWGFRIKTLIDQKGLKQFEVAEGIGTSPQNLSNWINDPYPKIEHIEKICLFLKISISDFFTIDNDAVKLNEISTECLILAKEIDSLGLKNKNKFLKHIETGLSLFSDD